jgi:hypothetical protein
MYVCSSVADHKRVKEEACDGRSPFLLVIEHFHSMHGPLRENSDFIQIIHTAH